MVLKKAAVIFLQVSTPIQDNVNLHPDYGHSVRPFFQDIPKCLADWANWPFKLWDIFSIFGGTLSILSLTPTRTHSISGVSSFEIDIFELKIMVKSGLDIFLF